MKTVIVLMALVLFPFMVSGEEEILEFEPIEQPTKDKISSYYYRYMYLMSRGPSEPHSIKAKPITEPLKPRQVTPSDWYGNRCLRVTFWAVETSEKCLVESITIGRGGTMGVSSSWYIRPRAIYNAAKMFGGPFRPEAVQWVDPKTFDLVDYSDYYNLLNDTDVKGPRIIRLKEKTEGSFEVTAISMGTVVPGKK